MEDIATLKEEEETYAGTWRQRKEAFGAIVDSLETMVESIRCLLPLLLSVLLC